MQVRPIISFSVSGSMQYYSTEDIHNGTSFYEGRVIDAGTVSYSMSDVYYGSQVVSPVTVKLDNSDGYFTNRISNEYRGALLTIKWLDMDTLTDIFTEAFRITDCSYSTSELTLTAYAQDVDAWQRTLPKHLITEALFGGDTIDENALNKPVPILLGECKNVPLYSIREYADGRHYFLIGYGQIYNVGSVYRSEMLVDTSEYTFFDGSQVSPWHGYAYLMFDTEQRDTNGQLYDMRADVSGLLMPGGYTPNISYCIYLLLNSSVFGLNLTCNQDSFVASDSIYPEVASIAIVDQKKASEIRDKLILATNGGRFYLNNAGETCLTIRQFISTDSATFTKYNMKDVTLTKVSSGESIKTFTVKGGYDVAKNTYTIEVSRDTYRPFGVVKDYESPYTGVQATVEKIANRLQRTMWFQDNILEFSTGADGYALNLGDIISVDYPQVGIINARYEIIGIDKSLDSVGIKAASYSSQIFE